MVDYNIAVPQPYDPSGDVANALRFRAQQQAEAENKLKMQAWLEDRAYTLQQRQAAAASNAAAKAKAAEIAGIYGENIGVSPAAVGMRGMSYSGTDVSTDPYARVQNELLKRGYLPQAQDLAEYQNKLATGKKTQAEIDKEAALAAKASAEKLGIDYENVTKRVNMYKNYAQMVKSGPEAGQLSLAMQNDPVLKDFASIAGDPQQAAARNTALFEANPQAWLTSMINLTPEQFITARVKADEAKQPKPTEVDLGGDKIFIDTNPQSPTFNQPLNTFAKSLTPSEYLTKKKNEWEMANPDYTIQETAQGMVAVNKKDPTDVKPIQLGGQTVMPTDKRSVTNIENYEPANVAAQKEFMQNVGKTREALQAAPATLENIERAKELIPEAKKFMGTGGEAYLTAAKFFNNRLGTSINVEGVKSAEELRSRLFMGVMDNLKKMDAQPTGRQQEALQEAIGQLDTDPAALPKVLDILGNSLRTKVDIYNKDVSDAEARGVKFPYKPQIDLPAQKVVGENTFPNEAAASQILKQRGAKPGDRVRVNIGGRTGTFVVE